MAAVTLSLFEGTQDRLDYAPPQDRATVVSGDLSDVRGLSFHPEFVTCGEERILLWQADQEGEWSTHWSRRTKFFGVRYDRNLRGVNDDAPIAPVPSWSDFVRRRLVDRKVMAKLPNQMGINEYMPGQGIAQHVDYFGGTVVSLSLGSGCVMDFTIPDDKDSRVSLWLPPRSVVVLQGDARNIWEHGIKGRLKDVINGHLIRRDRRVSITFRDVQV